MTRTEEELRKEYEEYSKMYNNPKHWEGWLIDEIGKVENYLEEVHKLAEFLTIEAGKHSIRCKELEHDIKTLELKAAAYDRLMSGGKKTLKEWANFLGLCVSINQGGVVFCSYRKPMRVHNGWLLAVDERPRLIIPMELIDYSGNWEDSLTLPDGWEEA